MSEKEMARNLLDRIPDEKLGYLIAYMQGMIAATAPEEPNEVTYSAMESARQGEVFGPFDSVADLMEALNA